MTKVFYVGYLRENTGWGQANRDNVKALLSAGFEVACRSIIINGGNDLDDQLIECERKDGYNADVCIEHVLPHHLTGTDNFKKNIAYLAYETSDIRAHGWFNHLKLMDQVWVPSSFLAQQLDPYFDVRVIPHACNIQKYYNARKTMSIKEIDHTFKFYTIMDLTQRKNIESILKCFHKEFDKTENVSLFIKVKNDHQAKTVENISNQLKQRLRIYNDKESYHQEVILPGYMSEEEILILHEYGDCFINLSHGEAWSIPTFDAMAMGKTPIVTANTGMDQYIEKNNTDLGWRVPSQFMVCDCSDSPFPELFSGREFWLQPDERIACHAMRQYFEFGEPRFYEVHKMKGLERAKLFSHESIGQIMKEAINE